jgi:hypothetical protein
MKDAMKYMKYWTMTEAERKMFDLVRDMRYLDIGLIPPSQYSSQEPGSLQACLESLDPVARRKACRKYRKLVRQSLKSRSSKSGFHTKMRAVKFRIESELFDFTGPDCDE